MPPPKLRLPLPKLLLDEERVGAPLPKLREGALLLPPKLREGAPLPKERVLPERVPLGENVPRGCADDDRLPKVEPLGRVTVVRVLLSRLLLPKVRLLPLPMERVPWFTPLRVPKRGWPPCCWLPKRLPLPKVRLPCPIRVPRP